MKEKNISSDDISYTLGPGAPLSKLDTVLGGGITTNQESAIPISLLLSFLTQELENHSKDNQQAQLRNEKSTEPMQYNKR